MNTLSGNDSAVLSALFDPESSLSSTVRIDSSVPLAIDLKKLSDARQEEREALRLINHETPPKSQIENAISKLSLVIETTPTYASAWSNRAQAHRLLLKDTELPNHPQEVEKIISDLKTAIDLATPTLPTDAVSSTNANVLSSAHTHRGYLLLLASKSDQARKMLATVSGLQNASREDLEEMASRELALGGRYGNETARQLAVKTNPYAKLCGSIVKEALQKEMSDYYQIRVKTSQ